MAIPTDLQEAIELSEEVLKFLGKPISHYIMAMAAGNVDNALKRLATVDPADKEEIRRLQDDIKLNQQFGNWLNNAVEIGAEAIQSLDSVDDLSREYNN